MPLNELAKQRKLWEDYKNGDADPEVTMVTKVEIYDDEFAESPRMWDNQTRMACAHRRYNLGDEELRGNSQSEVLSKIASDLNIDQYNEDGEELSSSELMEKIEEKAYIDALSLYDHSGITISRGVKNGWDSGQVGLVYVKKETLKDPDLASWKKEYWDGKSDEEIADAWIDMEIETYDKYLRNETYGIKTSVSVEVPNVGTIVVPEDEDASVGGFLGMDITENGMLDYVQTPKVEGKTALDFWEENNGSRWMVSGDTEELKMKAKMSELPEWLRETVEQEVESILASRVMIKEDPDGDVEENEVYIDGEPMNKEVFKDENTDLRVEKLSIFLEDNYLPNYEEELKEVLEELPSAHIIYSTKDDTLIPETQEEDFNVALDAIKASNEVVKIKAENKAKREQANKAKTAPKPSM